MKEKLDKEEFRLREMMIKKKHKVGYGTFLRNLNKNSSFCKVLKSKCLIKTTFSINFLRYVMTFQRKTENCFRSWRIVLKSTTLYYPKIAVNSNNEKSRFKKELNLQIQWLTCDIFFVLMLLDFQYIIFFLIQITENSVKFFYCYFQLEMGKKYVAWFPSRPLLDLSGFVRYILHTVILPDWTVEKWALSSFAFQSF